MKGMGEPLDTGRNPTPEEYARAQRIQRLSKSEQRKSPSAVRADTNQLDHINTYGDLPSFYIDQPFECRLCGKREIWRATAQKQYYEVHKGHIDAHAVECHACRKAKRAGNESTK